MDAFLKAGFSGPLVGVVLLGLGVLLWRKRSFFGARILAVLPIALGGLALVGSLAAIFGERAELSGWQDAPGTRVASVDGRQMHIWCDGEAIDDAPTAIIIPGGHGGGLNLYPLQQGLKTSMRSCLVDRLGTGWSDTPKTPRTTATIAHEIAVALDNTSEAGPYLFIGHSLGGQVAATLAGMEQKHNAFGLVTLDPTPHAMIEDALSRPDSWCYGTTPRTMALASKFGVAHLIPSLHPFNSERWKEENASLLDVRLPLKAQESRPSAMIYSSEALANMCLERDGVVRGEGVLGEVPILSIVQAQDPTLSLAWDSLTEDQKTPFIQWQGVTNAESWLVHQRMIQASTLEYPAMSVSGVLKRAPEGAGHNFPVSQSEFTVESILNQVALWSDDD